MMQLKLLCAGKIETDASCMLAVTHKSSLHESSIQLDVVYGYKMIWPSWQANTGGCTKEVCSFRDSYAEFQRHGALVFGASSDPVDKLAKFTKVGAATHSVVRSMGLHCCRQS